MKPRFQTPLSFAERLNESKSKFYQNKTYNKMKLSPD